jgi:ligand-binding sensor domain-containing protein
MADNKRILKFTVLLLLIICNSSIFAAGFGSLEFKHISTDMGLSQKTVQSIFQDRQGFIWVGTQEGLNRYDGREIRTYTHSINKPSSLSNNVIRAITEDGEGNLWIATSDGLNRLDIKNQSFQRIPLLTAEGNAIGKLYSLLNLDDGTLLIGTDGNGILTLDTNLEPFKAVPLANTKPLEGADVRTIFKDSRNRIWLGTDGQGVWLIDNRSDSPTNFSSSESLESISHNRIRSITEDSKGQIWIGTRGGGLNRFEERTRSFFHYKHNPNNNSSLSNNRVYDILEDSDARLWIATDGGINVLRDNNTTFTRIEHHPSQSNGLSHNRVLSLLESDGGLIWLGTMSGLDLWDPVTAKFVHYRNISEIKNSLSNNTVYGFTEDTQKGIYVATFGSGLNYFDVSNNVWSSIQNNNIGEPLNLDNRIISLLFDSKKRLWVGSFTNGLTVLSEDYQILKEFEHDSNNKSSLSANGITNIFEDSDGDIWIATYAAGLNRLNKDENSFIHYRSGNNPNQLNSDSILQIIEDDEGYIWLATDGGGISRLDKNTNEIINLNNEAGVKMSLSSNSILSIYQDRRGRFWIGTEGQGLNRWEPEDRRNLRSTFRQYTISDGLPSSTVNGVLEDEQGYIWISTNKGVSRLDPETDQLKNYNLAMGIHENELNQGSMLKASDGRLYFGGLNGISAFYPNEITSNLNKPSVVLTDILSENKSINANKSLSSLTEITFNYKDYLITFEFAALDYSQPEKNQYQYKLEGFDPDWIDSKNLNRATYTNLPSGQYLLKVKGSNNDGLWSDESINLPVTILPAPWATWWAFTIYSIIFCGFLILLIRSQAKRIANQDLFKQQVINEIESSTRSIELENRSLRKQLKNYEINSANDIETGLPNQTFFTEQVLISLALLEKQSKLNPKLKMFCAILSVKSNDNNTSQLVSKVAEQLSKTDNQIHLVARWNKNEIALLGFSDSQESLKKTINSIEKAFIDSQSTVSSCEHSLGYTINPLNRMDNYPFKWDNVLMITEHAARIASGLSDKNCIGLLACHQSLSSTTIKSIMSDSSLQSLKEKFDVTTH